MSHTVRSRGIDGGGRLLAANGLACDRRPGPPPIVGATSEDAVALGSAPGRRSTSRGGGASTVHQLSSRQVLVQVTVIGPDVHRQ
jgi:hypothetical protein